MTTASPLREQAGLSLMGLLRPHTKALAVGLLAVIGEGVAGLLEPWPLKIVFDYVGKSSQTHGKLDRLLPANMSPYTILELVAIAVIAIAILDAVCSYVEKYTTTSVGQWVTHDLRRLLYAHIQRLSLSYHTQRQTGDLISRLTTDIDAVQSFVVSSVLDLAIDTVTLVGMASVMFYLNWQFTLIALSIAPVLFGVTYYYTRRSKKASRDLRKKEGEIVSLLQEVLSAIGVVKAFAQEDYEQRRLEEKSIQSVQIALHARSIKAKLSPMVEIVVATGTALVLWFGGRLVLAGTLSAGSLVVFIWYLGKMYKPMQDFAKMTDAYAKASVGYERLREVLDTQPTVGDLPGAKILPPLKGEIEFEHVNFNYVPGRPILTDVSIKLPAGQMTALVGPTGSGKTTIASLIGRFYDPNSGAVRIDGDDLRALRQKSLHDQISYVLQENVLFNDTVWQNIAYGKQRATPGEIRRAAEMANAHEFISQLPRGYDTVVGERGVTLSGGQRQRIAIARAIIRDTPILILDEPSSGLDAASEELVFEAIDRLIEGRTTIVIAHRFSTIRRANAILVVEDGRIVENGRHDSLLAAGGLYAKLYELQFRCGDANSDAAVRAAVGIG
jgi:subfamily B ATP-binding cassette protein MsbA